MQIENRYKATKVRKTALYTIALILLISAAAVPIGMNNTNLLASAQAVSTVPSSMLQYEWLGINRDVAQTHFSAGPAPNTPTILWQKSMPGVGSDPVLFNGMLFVTQGSNIVAMDPMTGKTIYTVAVPKVLSDRSASATNIMKIDDTYMVAMSSTGSIVNATTSLPAAWALRGFRIADGSLVWQMSPQFGPTVAYRPRYVPDTKMIYTVVGNSTGRGGTQNPGGVQAWTFSDPTQPPSLAWSWINFGVTYGAGSVVYGDGRLFVGGSEPHQTCLNATTGKVLWETQLTGAIQYGGTYYNGVLYRGLLDNSFTAIDGNTGKVLWTNKPSAYGFWCSATAAAYGIVYETNVDGYFYAFNATTGNIVWKYLGPGQYYPGYAEIGDGKVYVATGQGVPSPITGQGIQEFTCFNATTGEVLWQVNKEFRSGPSDYQAIAYGNFYAVNQETVNGLSTYNSPPPKVLDTILYCYASEAATEGAAAPKDWPMYGSDPAHKAVSTESAPVNMAQKWVYHTGGAVTSSAVVVQGKVYIGSDDHNWYCLDANSGTKIWNFTIGYYIRSTAAVVNGKFYSGTDDGFAYCLDANTGSQLWKTPTPGQVLPIMTGTYPEYHSSPNVVDGKVYIGAIDGKLYCLDANSGSVIWALQTTGAILSNPTYIANDGLYFASVDGFVYKVNPSSGSVIWNVSTPIGLDIAMEGSACVGNNLVVIGSGGAKNSIAQLGQMYCFNATNGNRVWTYNQQNYNSTSPNLQPVWTPLYLNNSVLGPVFYFGDFFHMTCVNATNGNRLWTTYLTREHFGLPAYADNKLYIPSDTFGIYVCDATTGAKIGYFEAGAQVRTSPALYGGKVYFGSNNWDVFCVGWSSAATTYIGNPLPSPSPSPPPTQTPIPTNVPTSPTPIASPKPTSTQLPTATPSASVPPTPAGFPWATVYIAVAAIIIVIIVATIALILRRRK